MILITGATGFLGSELADQLLATGAAIRATKREGSAIPALLQGKPVEWVTADILDHFALEEAFAGVDAVYHCAALVSFDPSDRKKLHQANAEGTANVVNLCLENNVRLVHVSSVAALGKGKRGQLVTEDDTWEYDGHQHGYSISKYEAEMEVWRGIAEGLQAAIVNPSVIIGKNSGPGGSGKLFTSVQKGLLFYTGGGLGLVAVQDVARAMVLLMHSDISGQRFIVNAGNRSLRDIFSEIATCFGVSAPKFRLRPWMLSIAWRISGFLSLLTGKKGLITRNTARSAVKVHRYSSEKLQRTFPQFTFTPISQVIQETCLALKR